MTAPIKPAVRIFTDLSFGHNGFPVSMPIQGANRTFAENKRIVRVLDKYSPHTKCFNNEQGGGDGDGEGALGFTHGEGFGDGGSFFPPIQNPLEGEDSGVEEGDLTNAGVIVDKSASKDEIDLTTLTYETGDIILTSDTNTEDQLLQSEGIVVDDFTAWSPGKFLYNGDPLTSFTFVDSPSTDTLPEGLDAAMHSITSFDNQTQTGPFGRLEYTTNKTIVDEEVIEFVMYWAQGEASPQNIGQDEVRNRIYITHSENEFVTEGNCFAFFSFGRNLDGFQIADAGSGGVYPNGYVNLRVENLGSSLAGDDSRQNDWLKITAQCKKPAGSPNVPENSTIKVVLGVNAVGASMAACGPSMVANPDSGTGPTGPGYVQTDATMFEDRRPRTEAERPEVIKGCTNPAAQNFDPLAVEDDGSCILPGCMDVEAVNYDPEATVDDGSCEYEDIEGCMDPIAENYNPDATIDDGSCEYITGCMDPIAENYNPNATLDDGSCEYIDGCTDEAAANYDPNATRDDGSCRYADEYDGDPKVLGCTDPIAENYNPNATANDGTCIYIYGCTAENAVNYNPNATKDDGSCIFTDDYSSGLRIVGCTDPIAENYNPDAEADDGSCVYILGCTDETAVNYNPDATKDDGSCQFTETTDVDVIPIYGCTDPKAENFNPEATHEDESCEYIYGCTDPEAANHNEDATVDDGSCYYPEKVGGGDGTSGGGINDVPIYGCTDSKAQNWNPLATVDDGSCEYIYGCMDPTANNYDKDAQFDDGSCTYDEDPTEGQIKGCTQEWADNYDEEATVDDGSCYKYGCTDEIAENYDENATIDDGSCEYIIGCMDENADNYNPNATRPGICITSTGGGYADGVTRKDPDVVGCMDPEADNYVPNAGTPGICIYTDPVDGDVTTSPPIVEAGGVGCMDPNALNYVPGAIIPGVCYYRDGSVEVPGGTADRKDPDRVGCMDPTADNYDPLAGIPGVCIHVEPEGGFDVPGVSRKDPERTGCMDSKADNYDPLAGIPGPCIYTDPVDGDTTGTTGSLIRGCMDPLALNYEPLASLPGPCIYIEGGGQDGTTATGQGGGLPGGGTPTDSSEVQDGGTIVIGGGGGGFTATSIEVPGGDYPGTDYPDFPDTGPPLRPGCTDPNALNYDADATIDDGSCEYPPLIIYGCTDEEAINYSGPFPPEATVIDDGSCIYDAGEGDDVDETDADEEPDETCITHNPYALTGAPRVFVEGKALHRGVGVNPPGVAGDLLSCGDLAGYSNSRVLVGT